MMSSVTAAGRSSRTSRSPSWPPRAATTAKPARSRCRTTSSRTVGIVVHHQDQRLFRLLGDRMNGLRMFLLNLHDPRQPHGEGRALSRLTFHGDVATHHAAKMSTDGETKPCTTVFARGRGRGLRKLLKQLAHLLFGHANPGVGNCDRDPVTAGLGGDGDGTFLGELVGIARQIKQRLAKPGLVGVDRARPDRQSTTIRLPFFVAIGSMVLATSSISAISGNNSR